MFVPDSMKSNQAILCSEVRNSQRAKRRRRRNKEMPIPLASRASSSILWRFNKIIPHLINNISDDLSNR